MADKPETNWFHLFHTLAVTYSEKSMNRKAKVGAVIYNPLTHLMVAGDCNRLPRGMDESCERYHQQPVKAKVWEHAERNAIFYAARLGAELYGCGLAVNWYPCSDCARAIVQSGIIELVAEEPHWKDEKRGEDWLIAREILTAAGINIIYIYPNTKETEPLLETVLA